MSEELPKGWIDTNLKQVVLHKKGKKPKETIPIPKDGYVPYILIDEMEGKPIRAFTNDEKVPVANEDDVLIVWDGSIGKTATGIQGAIGSTIAALTPIVISPGFLNAFLQLSKIKVEQTSRGTGLQHINPTIFWPLKFPLPPFSEQKRIAATLEQIIPKIDGVNERLDCIPKIINRLRQSVLNAAVTGKLTEKWREEHPDVESAEVLLERIQKERKKRYQEEYEKAKMEGRKKPKKINISLKIDSDSLSFELPSNWSLANLDTICTEIVDCPHSTPKWTDKGKICLRTTNFLPNKLDWSKIRYVSKETYNKRIERLKPQKGDVLYSREGGILGVACILDRNIDICLGQRMMLMRTNKYMSYMYITYLLNSPIIRNHVNSLIGGSASPHINIGDIKNFPIPLPPLEEQRQIVRQVDKLFAFAVKLESHYKKAKEKIDKLKQSVLAKAFRGELVPQDPNDEPAEKLLERIKKEKPRLEMEMKKIRRYSARANK